MSLDPVAVRRFTESLSTHLEDHLAAWKSSLADARRDVETVLTAAAEKIPAHGKSLFPEDIMRMLLEDVLPPPAPPQKVVEVVEKVVERIVEKPVPVAGSLDWGVVRGSLVSVESARTQVDVLTRFLAEASAHASRVALLVLRNDRLTGWKALGYDATGGRDEAIKSIDLASGDDPFVADALKRERSLLAIPPAEGSPLRKALGGRPPARTLIVPMVIRDRLAGVVVADELPGDEGRLSEAAIEVLTFVTGFSVDLLAARKKIPSPTLTVPGDTIPVYAPAGAPSAATVHVPAVDLAPPAPAPAPAEPPRRPAPSAASLDQTDARSRRKLTDAGEALRALEESAAARKKEGPAAWEVSGAVPRPAPRPAAEPAPTPRPVPPLAPAAPPRPAAPPVSAEVPAPPQRPAAPPPSAATVAVPPATPGDLTMAFDQLKAGQAAAQARPAAPVAPPAPPAAPPALRPVAPAPPPPAAPAPAEALPAGGATPMAAPAGFVPRSRLAKGDDPRRAIEDAKRLARLLVSEIKLYNERKVEEGRTAGDIYSRLKDDIERSRQVYAERTPEAVRREGDFFHDELVRILADGRADALGPVH